MVSRPRIRFLSFRYFSEALIECGFNLEVLLPKSLLASNLKGLKKSFLPRDRSDSIKNIQIRLLMPSQLTQ